MIELVHLGKTAGKLILEPLCSGQFQDRPCPPPGQTPGHLTFLKNFGQIPRYVASLDGLMPHPLELQRGSNPPPSRHVKQPVETSSAKFSTTTNFLFCLSSLHTLRSAHTMGLVPTTSPCNKSQGLVASCELATSPCD